MIGMAEKLLPNPAEEAYGSQSVLNSHGNTFQSEISAPVLDREQTMRFVKMMSYTMADQLETVIMNSVSAYTEFWREYAIDRESSVYYAGEQK